MGERLDCLVFLENQAFEQKDVCGKVIRNDLAHELGCLDRIQAERVLLRRSEIGCSGDRISSGRSFADPLDHWCCLFGLVEPEQRGSEVGAFPTGCRVSGVGVDDLARQVGVFLIPLHLAPGPSHPVCGM